MSKVDPQAVRDRELLVAVFEHPGFEHLDHGDAGDPREIFDGWLKRLENNGSTRPLSEKQRNWLHAIARKLDLDTGAENLVSSGAMVVKPKERENPIAFLNTLDRPNLPPHRRCLIKRSCLQAKGHRGECDV